MESERESRIVSLKANVPPLRSTMRTGRKPVRREHRAQTGKANPPGSPNCGVPGVPAQAPKCSRGGRRSSVSKSSPLPLPSSLRKATSPPRPPPFSVTKPRACPRPNFHCKEMKSLGSRSAGTWLLKSQGACSPVSGTHGKVRGPQVRRH